MNSIPTKQTELISLRSRFETPLKRGLYRIAGPLVEKSFAIREFNRRYARAAMHFQGQDNAGSMKSWFAACLNSFGIQYSPSGGSLEKIPASGPLIIVANHPFGFADAIILGHLIGQARTDAKFLANSMLLKIPEVQPWIIPVDNFNGGGSERRNLGPMKKAVRHLVTGGALIIFPAGEVAHFQMGRGIEECPWNDHLGALVKLTGATVLPVYFAGRNSILFQIAGLLHPRARTSLLLRELCARRNRPVKVRVGDPVPYGRLKRFTDHAGLTGHLRLLTLALGYQSEDPGMSESSAPVMAEDSDPRLALEIARLKANGKLLAKHGCFGVYVAEAGEIPLCLQEIGRLREVTFRGVGEGTGHEIDLDIFDQTYLHLILWDAALARIAGGYRLGRADLLIREHGSSGLYTHTLFHFSRDFLAKMDCALELGRSFIRWEYQRHPAALALLWKGICAWVREHPKYKLLFGAVSISDEYDEVSRSLIVDFFTSQRQALELRSMATARNPFRSRINKILKREIGQNPLNNDEDLSRLISTIERDRKGLPVLLKHYLKLNASILCFNVDRAFSSVVDGLILVDLTKTSPIWLARQMGNEGAQVYLSGHGNRPGKAVPEPNH